MKKTIAATLALGLGVGLGVSGASAQNRRLEGSDTLFDITNNMLTLCGISPTNLQYFGGGSTVGENRLIAGTQQIAPMSRFLSTTAGTGACVQAAPNNIGRGIAHSLDAIGVLSDDTEATTCGTLRHTGTLVVPPAANGNTTLECPNCAGTPDSTGADTYVFTEWQQALRIIYAGKHATIAANACAATPPSAPLATVEPKVCDSDVRFALVNSWSNMFEGGCTDGECSALKHAFRRDDVSGTTETFLSLLSLPGISSAPFCNGTEFEDNDPIRRNCDGNGQSSNGENVCRRTSRSKETTNAAPQVTSWGAVTAANAPTPAGIGDLGLVLPIIIPEVLSEQYNNNNPCAAAGFGGRFRFAPMPLSTLPPAQQLCPNGTLRAFNGCLWPVDAAGNYGCVNSANNRPVGVAGFATAMDGRVYNMTPRSATGLIPTVRRGTANRPMLNVGFYRIHQRTLQTNASGSTCQQPDATEQIGCLVHASPCSLGYAGLTADQQNPNKVLDLATPLAAAAGGVTVAATKPNVRRLLEDCTTGDFDLRYPLSRKLWLNTLIGFENVINNPGGIVTQEAQLLHCWQDRRFVDRAAAAAGFVTLSDNSCETQALPADPTSFTIPVECDLSDDNPGTEIQACP